MSFNAAATRLAVSSSNRTIHIFDVSHGQGGQGGQGRQGDSGGSGGGGVERGRSRRRSNSSPRLTGGGSGASGRGGQGQEVFDDVGGDAGTARRKGAADGRSNDTGAGSAGGGLVSGFRSVVGLLPNRVTKRVQDYVDSNRSFASVRLRGGTGRSICALIPAGDRGAWANRGGARAGGPGEGKGRAAAGGRNDNRGEEEEEDEEEEEGEILLVVTNEGILYSYVVDTIRGGECRLEQASSLLLDPNASQEIGSELYVPERRAPPVLAGQG